MNAHLHPTGAPAERGPTTGDGKGRLVGGLVLLGAGLVLLAAQFVNLGAWILIILGMVFLAAGVATRSMGWFIPSGVLNGIGLGALLIESGIVVNETAQGGMFLVAFALGWLSIYVLTRLFTAATQTWALIPAAIMALIGVPLLLGAPGEAALAAVLSVLGYLWPLALIAAGVVVLIRMRRS